MHLFPLQVLALLVVPAPFVLELLYLVPAYPSSVPGIELSIRAARAPPSLRPAAAFPPLKTSAPPPKMTASSREKLAVLPPKIDTLSPKLALQ
eukprot:113902-Rhodomonas_salina.1